MKPRIHDYAPVAVTRWWGVRMVGFWACAERPAIAAPTSAPQVSLTVIHVQAGAVLSIGGVVLDPRSIPAVPQQRAAITTTTEITGGETE